MTCDEGIYIIKEKRIFFINLIHTIESFAGRPCQRCLKRNIGAMCHDEPRTSSTASSTAVVKKGEKRKSSSSSSSESSNSEGILKKKVNTPIVFFTHDVVETFTPIPTTTMMNPLGNSEVHILK